ncbi:MAG TPA: hypothetical protein VKU00_06345 [Chthonomonadaceae bacterium]|nr:hypothetical protein [Chthonomonadaceae bacterium]
MQHAISRPSGYGIALLLGVVAALSTGCGGGSGLVSAGNTLAVSDATGRGAPLQAASWSRLPDPFNSNYTLALEDIGVSSNGNLYAAGFGGVAYSANGGKTWTNISKGLPLSANDKGQPIYRALTIGFNSLGDPIVEMGFSPIIGVYRYTGGSWHKASGITANFRVAKFALDKTGALLAVTAWEGDVFRSTDNGNSFVKAAGAVGSPNGITVGALWTILKANDGSLYTAGEVEAGMFHSTDNGTTWNNVGLGKAQGYLGNIRALGLNAKGELLAGRTGPAGDPLQRLTSTGWVSSAKGMPVWLTVKGLAMTPTNEIQVSLTTETSGSIYHSLDNGQTWQSYSTGLPNAAMGSLVIDKAGSSYVAVGANSIYKR